jgi:hypothetical protein
VSPAAEAAGIALNRICVDPGFLLRQVAWSTISILLRRLGELTGAGFAC